MELLTTILLWILIGALAGWIASMIMGARQDFWWNVIIGIIGAFIGGLIFNLLGLPTAGLGWSLLAAILGAIVVIAIVRAIWRRPATTT
ncbi:MAG: GlsB/YeaQ/YmgE family stress response membrane protein [Armatimonadota bacterium]